MSNGHFVSDRHPASTRTAIFEDDGTSAWMYLTEANSGRPIADAWIHNCTEQPANNAMVDRNGPPPAPSSYADPTAACKHADEYRWSFKWDASGESVALLKDDQPVAFIVAGQNRGFSRLLRKDGPWGQVWREELFQQVFASPS